ncbi:MULTISPECIES: helix-turn-helix transcriptional regulator [unclassified Nocardioides]|uniref:helix-turn-helix transcriptional regulator n=1 Tax=Nocardioides sp. URHA0032 TaxID=1380388 RepID=UPI0009E01466|nr:response regulator transcription factor [Nocardioides sp. URHA0032]
MALELRSTPVSIRWRVAKLLVVGKPVTAAVVSPFDIVRAGFADALRRHCDLVEVRDVSTQDGHLCSLDVVLYDLCALEGGGDDLRHLVAGNAVVAGIEHDREEAAAERLRALARAHGVSRFVSIRSTADEILTAILDSASAAGGPPSPAPDQASGPERHTSIHGLTRRELDVLAGVVAGQTNQEIADDIYLSINSVKSYVRSAYRKIGVTSRSQAVLWMFEHAFEVPLGDADVGRPGETDPSDRS